jgi:intermembrane space import and assembly protein 40
MPVIHKEGKDTIIFASKEDHETPSKVALPEPESSPGLLLDNGEINWNCPCLGGMATGPCGLEFREAFSCFHYSTANPKGSECYETFKTMENCMLKYPAVYESKGASMDDLKKDELEEDEEEEEEEEDAQSSSNSKDKRTVMSSQEVTFDRNIENTVNASSTKQKTS